jgi:hypothetical protein
MAGDCYSRLHSASGAGNSFQRTPLGIDGEEEGDYRSRQHQTSSEGIPHEYLSSFP